MLDASTTARNLWSSRYFGIDGLSHKNNSIALGYGSNIIDDLRIQLIQKAELLEQLSSNGFV